MKIKAAVFREIHQPLSIEDVDVGDPGPDEVLVKTVARIDYRHRLITG